MAESVARVLVIDDELFFREAIRDILAEVGCEVLEAGDGEAGLALAADPAVGVAIVDIRLPGIGGLDVLRELRERRPAMRVIMLSAHTDQELVLEALRRGACDYLAKPLHDEELVLAVRRAADAFALSEDWDGLRGRLEGLVERVEALHEAAAAEPGEDATAALCGAAAQIVVEVLELRRASVMLVGSEGQDLRVAAAVGHPDDPAGYPAVTLGEGIAGAVCAGGEALVVSDVDGDARVPGHAPAGRYESGAFAVVPLVAGERGLGVLCATERRGGAAFRAEDVDLLRLLAAQLSQGLLRWEVAAGPAEDAPASRPEAVGARDALAEVDAEAELARMVCDAIVSEVEPARIYDAALRAIADALPAAPVSLYLLDPDDGVLRCEATHDGGLRSDREALDAEQGLAGAVLRSGRMVASDSPEADGRFDPGVDTPEDGKAGPLLCVPIRLRGKGIGVFRAFLRGGVPASARAGEVLGPALSAAVRNALLYRSLLDSVEEVAEARRAARRA